MIIRAALVWLALCLPLAAQQGAPMPDWQHTSINDFAGLLDNDDTRVLDQALIALFDDTGVEGTVVTLNGRAAYGDDSLESFSTRLFNHWGIGDSQRNDGFMVLVLADDREARIELGAGYRREADLIAQEIMRQTMLPEFRADRMSSGIREGALDVIEHIARPVAQGLAPTEARPPRATDSIAKLVGAGIFGVVFLAIGRNIWRRIQHGRRPCPRCGGRGLVEEIEPQPVQSPDGGPMRQSVWTRCARCGWQVHNTRDAPRRSTAARRSSGFGGGRSRGGGASGRW